MTRHRPRDCRRAFTLIELVLALGLTVVIATVLASAVYVAYHAKQSVYRSLEIARAGDNTAILARELAATLPPTPSSTNTGLGTVTGLSNALAAPNGNLIGAFLGQADNVDFFASGTEPKSDFLHDIREIQYLLTTDADNNQVLVRHVYTNPLPVDNTEVPPDEVICRNVQSFALSYFDGTNWTDTWDSTQQNKAIPTVVRFDIQLAPLTQGAQPRTITRYVPIPCAQPSSTDTSTSGTSTTGGTP